MSLIHISSSKLLHCEVCEKDISFHGTNYTDVMNTLTVFKCCDEWWSLGKIFDLILYELYNILKYIIYFHVHSAHISTT